MGPGWDQVAAGGSSCDRAAFRVSSNMRGDGWGQTQSSSLHLHQHQRFAVPCQSILASTKARRCMGSFWRALPPAKEAPLSQLFVLRVLKVWVVYILVGTEPAERREGLSLSPPDSQSASGRGKLQLHESWSYGCFPLLWLFWVAVQPQLLHKHQQKPSSTLPLLSSCLSLSLCLFLPALSDYSLPHLLPHIPS